jgi:hypothetical protein
MFDTPLIPYGSNLSVIVLGIASYHNVVVLLLPTSNFKLEKENDRMAGRKMYSFLV